MDAINGADTTWVLISAALVMLMTPGLALFYGGLVREKNVLSTIMHSFFILALISVQWVLWGYTLAFGASQGGVIGGLNYLGLNGVGVEPNADYAATIPHLVFMVFQMMFAVITPALISGAFAERKRFKACMPRWHTGCGASAAGFVNLARSISPVAQLSISHPVSRRSCVLWCWGSALAMVHSRCRRITQP